MSLLKLIRRCLKSLAHADDLGCCRCPLLFDVVNVVIFEIVVGHDPGGLVGARRAAARLEFNVGIAAQRQTRLLLDRLPQPLSFCPDDVRLDDGECGIIRLAIRDLELVPVIVV
jgi:hypothetical protein